MTPSRRAEGRVVLITGAGSGIGRAAALAFAREGAVLALMGRRREPLAALAAHITAAGTQAAVLPGDITRASDVRATVQGCVGQFGRVDTLVHCAGVAGPAVLTHETSDAVWNELLDVNLTGAFRMIRTVLAVMLTQGRGAIVNVASIAGLVGMAEMAAYGAAKGGLVALTRAVAVEYGPRGIRCNCLCPGTVATPMTAAALAHARTRAACETANPLCRIASAEEIAETILHLSNPESSFVNGAVVPIDGGYTAR